METPYIFHPDLVLRTPSLPFNENMQGFDPDILARDKNFLEALWLASPVLHEALLKYRDGKVTEEKDVTDLVHSLGKYFLRMSVRCTPFGLFSGCSIASWREGEKTGIRRGKPRRHTRFDMHYLCALAQHLAGLPFIREKVSWFPNTSWYRIGDEIRYVEYRYENGRRHHQISSVCHSEYLTAVLHKAKEGVVLAEIVTLLTAGDIDEEEAREFAGELISAQLLISELEPAITGDEFLSQMIAVLKKIDTGAEGELRRLCELLEHLDKLLHRIDNAGVNEVSAYEEIIGCVKQLGVSFDKNKLFQADTFYDPGTGGVDTAWQSRLMDSLDVLNRLNTRQESRNLLSFKKRFYERYEAREMPLLEVLDTETGIGYLEGYSGDVVPLVDDLQGVDKPGQETLIAFTSRDKFLAGKVADAMSRKALSIELDPAEMGSYKNDWDHLPPSLSVMFRLLPEGKLFIENAGGSSAVNLLGRFAHGSGEIHSMVKDIVGLEERTNPDILFAEIVHLPESRIGNVLLHPAFRSFEIPFLARSSAPADGRIPLQDLLVSVRNDRILLRSASLKKEVIPRLSTAHNYSFKALPVYQFLCDLQLQGKQGGLFFHWGVLGNQFTFLPRVTCQDIVVSPAQWFLQKKDIEVLNNSNAAEWKAAVARFREQWNLPPLLVLSDGDNELFINLEDEKMARIWLDAVGNRNSFLLKEFLGTGKEAGVVDQQGRGLSNQFIASLIKKTPSYGQTAFPVESPLGHPLPQRFPVGSEWVYLKLFCGARTADKILLSGIRPLVTQLLASGWIDRFFFIRYNDPSFHLRLRLHLTDMIHLGPVMELFRRHVDPFETEGFLWKVQADTYQREVERYGVSSMTASEELFFIDSYCVLEMLTHLESVRWQEGDEEISRVRWLWLLRSIDEWLDVLGLATSQKLAIAQHLRDSFHSEFGADKTLRGLLSGKYRTYKQPIAAFLDRANDPGSRWHPLLSLLQRRNRQLFAVGGRLQQLAKEGQLEVAMPELIYSHIHMMVNRVASSEPRLHELVLYDLLFTWYRSVIGREKYGKDKNINSAA
jgi:thiopeptide-type bacteriocin biosynthesis protein